VCKLCDAINIKKDYELEIEGFVIMTCNHCNIPMIVLKEHKAGLTSKEKTRFNMILRNYFNKKYKPRGIGMREVPEHWHEHLLEI